METYKKKNKRRKNIRAKKQKRKWQKLQYNFCGFILPQTALESAIFCSDTVLFQNEEISKKAHEMHRV